MNIVRKIHDQFRVKTIAGAQLETPEAVSSQGAGGSTFITITGGGGSSLSGSGLSEEDRVKLDSIEQGAQVNQDAFSKIQFDATSIDENDQSSSSNSSIIANVPTDTANIKIVGNYPITVNLESVSLFNSKTSTTTGTAITTYNISFDDSNNIVIEYVTGTLLNVTEIELIQVKHKEDVLATYQLSDITYTTSDGTITSFTIPYSNTDFSEIDFCKYETVTTETEEGSTTVRELRVLSVLPTSPTKQSIITLNSLTDSFWNYEEDENGNKFVWTDYNVYSTKDVSAYGRGTDLGDSYASNLYELKDVVLTNLSNNDLLIYNSSTSKWVNINKDQLGISADQLHTLTISVNGVTQAVYNPASANASVNIPTITLDEVTEYIDQKIDTKLDASEFFKWFTINYDSSNNVVSIQANFDFYSIEGVSAYGLGEGEEEPSYVSSLGELSDVTLTDVASNNILLYNGSKWVNKPMSSIVVDAYTKSEIDTKLSSISSEISTLKSNVTSIYSNITGIRGDITNIQSNITNIQGDVTNIQSNIATIQNSISNITSVISTINATISDIQTTLTGKLDKNDFFTWFTIIKNTSGEVVSIQANFDFYSIGEVSAYGLGDIGGSGRTTLATLDDVSLSNLITNDMLAYNGSKWVNIPMSQVRGVTSWADLENKPTTLSGFGITDVYTKTQVDSKISAVSNKLDDFLTGSDTDTIINKWKELESFLAGYTQTQTLAELLSVKANSSVKISAGTGLTGGGDLTTDRTISLATSGVIAGIYTKVTVDTYGRVTSGSTLSASDIPNLDWSKITSGKPTTLAGYGITDGVNSVTITGTGNAITTATITDHILTLTKGNTFLQQSIFDDLFEKVNIGTTVSPVYAIKAKYHFYSVGEVSAYEFGDTSGGGAKTLAELQDVQLTSLSSDQILKYNGSKWVNVPITEVKGATSWNEIEDKPTTFTPSAHTHTVADITNISTLTLQVNGSSLATFNGKANVTANIAVPTKLSQLTDDVVSGKYLPLTGGTMTGDIILDGYSYLLKKVKVDNSNYEFAVMWCNADGTTKLAEIGYWNTNQFVYINPVGSSEVYSDAVGKYSLIIGNNKFSWNTYTILHSANWSSYCAPASHTHSYLPLSGGTVTGPIEINSSVNNNYNEGLRITRAGNSWAGITFGSTGISGAPTNGWFVATNPNNQFIITPDNSSNTTGLTLNKSGDALWRNNTILHSNNYNSYAPTLTGTGASGTWGISITGNANTATNADKLDGYDATPTSSSYVNPWNTIPVIKSDGVMEIGRYLDFHFDNTSKLDYSCRLQTDANNQNVVRLPSASGTLALTTDNVASATDAANANKLGGYNASDYIRATYDGNMDINKIGVPMILRLYITNPNLPSGSTFYYGNLLNIKAPGTDTAFQLLSSYSSDTLYFRRGTWNSSGTGSLSTNAWKQIAFIDSNVASATKLQTARYICGWLFDGTRDIANVSLELFKNPADYSGGWARAIDVKSSSGSVLGAVGFYGVGNSLNYAYFGDMYNAPWATFNSALTRFYKPVYVESNILITSKVGIGTTVPTEKLHVVGNIIATGEVTAKASSSDIRLKTDISDYKALSIIRNHKSVKYHWNEVAKSNADIFNDDDWHFGLIAQDLQKDLPQMVSNIFKDYLVINYERLIPICWKGLQEVDDEVTKLKKRVKQLERRLQKYESTEVFYIKGND